MNKKTFIIGSVLLGLSATAWWIKTQIDLMSKVTYSVGNYTVKSISSKGIVLLINLNLKNKGAFDVVLRGYDFDVYGDGNFLVRAFSNQEVNIKPFSDTVLPIEILINLKTLAQGLGGALTGASDWKSIYIEFKGSLKVKKGILSFPVPIRYGATIKELAELK